MGRIRGFAYSIGCGERTLLLIIYGAYSRTGQVVILLIFLICMLRRLVFIIAVSVGNPRMCSKLYLSLRCFGARMIKWSKLCILSCTDIIARVYHRSYQQSNKLSFGVCRAWNYGKAAH